MLAVLVLGLLFTPLQTKLSAAEPVHPRLLRLQFVAHGNLDLGTLSVEARPLGSEAAGVPAQKQTIHRQEILTLDLDPAVAWEISVLGPGVWAPALMIPGGTRPSEAQIHLWRTARLEGEVRLSPDEAEPENVQLRFAPYPPGLGAPPAARLTCPVVDRRWSCEVPAPASLDLALRARGFVTHYFWAMPLAAGETRRFPPLLLVRGASMVGFVGVEDGTFTSSECVVTAEPVGQPADFLAERDRQRRILVEVQPTERGFFHFEGLTSGSYAIRVRYPGFSDAVVGPIFVPENIEVELREPVLLQRLRTVRVELDPPAPGNDRLWRVRLWNLDGLGGGAAEGESKVHELEVPADGRLEVSGLLAGAYRVVVMDSSGEPLAGEVFEVSRDPTNVRLEVHRTAVEGKVRLGGETLAASLHFQRRAGVGGATFQADSKGEFRGTLPGTGTWTVTITSKEPLVRSVFPEIEVSHQKGAEPIRLDFELPAGRLRGRVLHENGEAVEKASVLFLAAPGSKKAAPMGVTTDDEGRFEMTALPEGTGRIFASTSDALSEVLPVLVSESDHGPEVELRLRAMRTVSGFVTTPSGMPLAGVELEILPILSTHGGQPPIPYQTVTGLDGTWSVRVPRATASVAVIGFTTGFPLLVQRRSLPEDSFLLLRAEEVGADLRFAPESGDLPQHLPSGSELAVLYVNGVGVLGGQLWQWAVRHTRGVTGDTLLPPVAPRLPPGPVQFCWLRSDEIRIEDFRAYRLSPPAGAACTNGEIIPGLEATLTLPPLKHAKPRPLR